MGTGSSPPSRASSGNSLLTRTRRSLERKQHVREAEARPLAIFTKLQYHRAFVVAARHNFVVVSSI